MLFTKTKSQLNEENSKLKVAMEDQDVFGDLEVTESLTHWFTN